MSALSSTITPLDFAVAPGSSLVKGTKDLLNWLPAAIAGTRLSQSFRVATTSPRVSVIPAEVRSEATSALSEGVKSRSNALDDAFARTFSDALQMADWEEIEAPDVDCWRVARRFLQVFFDDRLFPALDLPLITPLDLGGISVEWHKHGLNIELRFRPGGYVYVIVEDARRTIPKHSGRDPSFRAAIEGIVELALRSK
ncbi:MAG: hypothetical protein ING10_05645 [Roseomonas sp.]|nr:hypothetical protein [Roseomonas sp.]